MLYLLAFVEWCVVWVSACVCLCVSVFVINVCVAGRNSNPKLTLKLMLTLKSASTPQRKGNLGNQMATLHAFVVLRVNLSVSRVTAFSHHVISFFANPSSLTCGCSDIVGRTSRVLNEWEWMEQNYNLFGKPKYNYYFSLYSAEISHVTTESHIILMKLQWSLIQFGFFLIWTNWQALLSVMWLHMGCSQKTGEFQKLSFGVWSDRT